MTTTNDEPLEQDAAAEAALDLRRPDVPVTVDQIAALGDAGTAIIKARELVMMTARKAAIKMTAPPDWILFRSPDNVITAYLQDCGGDRIRDILGIEIFNVSRPEKVQGPEPQIFHYLVTGDGRCRLTQQRIENVEGGRSSTDEFAKGKTGIELELMIRKAARANLDGSITRELAGLKSVPVEELTAAWVGTTKSVEQCHLGRGFGSRDERLGARSEKAPDVDPPVCPHCGAKGVYRPGKNNRAAFYGCPNYGKHPDQKFIINATDWERQQRAKNGTTAEPAAVEPKPAAAPLTDTDINFG